MYTKYCKHYVNIHSISNKLPFYRVSTWQRILLLQLNLSSNKYDLKVCVYTDIIQRCTSFLISPINKWALMSVLSVVLPIIQGNIWLYYLQSWQFTMITFKSVITFYCTSYSIFVCAQPKRYSYCLMRLCGFPTQIVRAGHTVW